MITAKGRPGVFGSNKGSIRDNDSADAAALKMNAPT
jgi:hypothetical protein